MVLSIKKILSQARDNLAAFQELLRNLPREYVNLIVARISWGTFEEGRRLSTGIYKEERIYRVEKVSSSSRTCLLERKCKGKGPESEVPPPPIYRSFTAWRSY